MIDGAFDGQAIVLELKNMGNFRMRLKHKDPIAMIIFAQLTDKVTLGISNKYGGQNKITPPFLRL